MNPPFLKVAIVDDEPHCIHYLEKAIATYCPEVESILSYSSFFSGLEELRKSPPDILFLDIEMPEGTGFDFLAFLKRAEVKVIFTTAHSQYAIQAIRVEAVDYLMKPVHPRELRASIDRVVRGRRAEPPIVNGDSYPKVAFPTQQGMLFKDPKDIIRCEADGAYTKIIMESETLIVSKNIKLLEPILLPHQFFRVHRSHLINLYHLQQYIKGNGGIAVMSDGSQVLISKRRREELLAALT